MARLQEALLLHHRTKILEILEILMIVINKKLFVLLINIILITSNNTYSVILEDLQERGVLEVALKDKVVGYYVGSFDPIHLAHQAVAETILNLSLCDFVIIYPVWGGDNYKKKAPVEIRLEMIFAALANHPGIIVTKLEPRELQLALTDMIITDSLIPAIAMGARTKPARFIKKFIGILGSDQALDLCIPKELPNHETHRQLWLSFFMRGTIVHEPLYDCDKSLACISALPVTSFIVSLRNQDDVAILNSRIGDREFQVINEASILRTVSSSHIKDLLENDEAASKDLLDPGVWAVIGKQQLYRRRSESSAEST